MPPRHFARVLVVMSMLTLVLPFAVAKDNAPTTPPLATAVSTAKPPLLDGEVIADPAWQIAVPVTGFWQNSPDEGQPASQNTEVRILYTADTLYFGVVCFDKEPARIIVSDSRRDAPLDETDCFQIILDTYHDKQNGFVFSTNPAGIEYDAQITNEGQGEGGNLRQQSGAVGGFNINWDGAWEVRTKTSAEGWSAEFAIPFRTLRYKSGAEQIWGLNFQRNIRRRNENAFWAPVPRQFNLFRLSQAGTLQGLQLAAPRNFKLMPYLLTASKFQEFRTLNKDQWQGDFGADVKYSLSPALTLDATYNTDFAQVEVDEQQINLDRFNLFFPEKRPFFLENAGLFTVGSPGELEVFFSRRIGLDDSGRAVPIIGGARLSGKIGPSDIGLLNMQTEALDGKPANNFTVARFKQELPNRSKLGAILVNRQGTAKLAPEEDYNRTFAIDGKLGYGKSGQVAGFFAQTFTPGIRSKRHAFKIGTAYDVPMLSLSANYTESAEGFDPQVGFLQRTSFRKPDGLVLLRLRPTHFMGIQELRPHVSYRGYWDFTGFQETGYLHIDNHWEWKSGHEIHTGINFTREGVKTPFEIFPGINVRTGTYDNSEVMVVLMSNQGAWWSVESRWTIGGYFGGDRVSVQNTAKMRLGETLNTEVGWTRNDINLPEGDFITNLIRWRLSYSFTPRLFVQSLLQFNDLADLRATNVRLGWLQSANTGLFVVYTETHGWDEADPRLPSDRQLTLKYSRLFDVLH